LYKSSAVAEMGERVPEQSGPKSGPTSVPSCILIHPAVWPQ